MPPAISTPDRFLATPYAERNAQIIHALVAVGWSAQAQRVARDLQFIPIDLVGPRTIAELAEHAARVETGRTGGVRFASARARFLALVEDARVGRDT